MTSCLFWKNRQLFLCTETAVHLFDERLFFMEGEPNLNTQDVYKRQILKNSEMPIGVLVSIIGAPCFIYLLVRKSYGFGGSK